MPAQGPPGHERRQGEAGHAPTGRRFERIDEVSSPCIRPSRIVRAWGIEDTVTGLRQLGLPEVTRGHQPR